MYRYRPSEYEMRARPIDEYPANSRQAAAIMLMIRNNLDVEVQRFAPLIAGERETEAWGAYDPALFS